MIQAPNFHSATGGAIKSHPRPPPCLRAPVGSGSISILPPANTSFRSPMREMAGFASHNLSPTRCCRGPLTRSRSLAPSFSPYPSSQGFAQFRSRRRSAHLQAPDLRISWTTAARLLNVNCFDTSYGQNTPRHRLLRSHRFGSLYLFHQRARLFHSWSRQQSARGVFRGSG